MILSSGSVLSLLRNLSSQFADILFYGQFLSLPLRDVIYACSIMVNIILKIRNIISILEVFKLKSFIY